MCNICHLSICDEACPDFDGRIAGVGYPVARCFICDEAVYDSKEIFDIGDKCYCKDCLNEMAISDFSELFGFGDISELIITLGGFYCQE